MFFGKLKKTWFFQKFQLQIIFVKFAEKSTSNRYLERGNAESIFSLKKGALGA